MPVEYYDLLLDRKRRAAGRSAEQPTSEFGSNGRPTSNRPHHESEAQRYSILVPKIRPCYIFPIDEKQISHHVLMDNCVV